MTIETMDLSDALACRSADYPETTVGGVTDAMREEQGGDCWHCDDGYETCEDWIGVLAYDMIQNGWNGPPVCIGVDHYGPRDPKSGKPTGKKLTNGHHRVWAAQRAGITTIPVTDDLSESGMQEEGDGW